MQLTCKLINGEELDFKISKKTFVIGRSNQVDIVIPHEGISRRHLQISAKGGQLFITDLGSANGVFIDDKKIQPNVETPFPEYLNLAFGPVQSLRITNIEETILLERPTTILSPLNNEAAALKMNPGVRRTPVAPGRTRPDNTKKRPAAKGPNQGRALLLMATVMVILFVGYLYYQEKKSESEPMSHSEMYE